MTLDGIRAGGKAALARALSAVEADPEAAADLLDAALAAQRAATLGITGPPGVGKSTLVGALVPRLRTRGLTVGVLAVDPSSRRTGGALLGDRVRLRTDPADEGVFMRSVAAGEALGGLAASVFPAVVLLGALRDVVIVETVGVGQSEGEVREVADRVVLCAEPGAGDAVQFMKAGILELPDLVVVTKADRGPAAAETAAALAGALSLSSAPPAVETVAALAGAGLGAVEALLSGLPAAAAPLRRRVQAAAWIATRLRHDFGRFALERLRERLRSPPEAPFRLNARLSAVLRESLQNLRLDV